MTTPEDPGAPEPTFEPAGNAEDLPLPDPDWPAPIVESAWYRKPVFVITSVLGTLLVAIGIAGYLWLSNTDQTPAEVVPAGVDFYASVDVLRLFEPDTLALANTVGDVFAQLDPAPAQENVDPAQELDDALLEEYGFDFTNDIQPWVGRTMAVAADVDEVAITDLQSNVLTPIPEELGDGLLVVSVRDTEAADAFLTKLTAGLDVPFAPVVVAGEDMLAGGEPEIVLGRVDKMMFAGTRQMVERALDPDGSRLSNDPLFANLTASLPDDRFVTVFTDIDLNGVSAASSTMGSTQAAFSVSIRSNGVAFDSVTAATDDVFDIASSIVADSDVIGRLDSDTLAFVQTAPVAVFWQQFEALAPDLDPDALDAIERNRVEFEALLGFDIVDGLLMPLDGATTFAVGHKETGAIYDTLGVPLSATIAMRTSRGEVVADSLLELVEYATNELGAAIRSDGTRHVIAGDATEFASIGVVGDWLAVSSDPATLDAMESAPANPLIADADYEAAVEALPDGFDTYVYLDMLGIVDSFVDDADIVDALEAFRAVIVGGRIADGRIHASGMLLIQDPEAVDAGQG